MADAPASSISAPEMEYSGTEKKNPNPNPKKKKRNILGKH